MTSQPTITLPVEQTEKTTAGNYFVSNYPPFSFWSGDAVPDFREMIDSAPREKSPLGLYVHIPFCRKRCHFCYFKVYTDKNASEIKTYNHTVAKELALYKDRAFLGGRKPKFVYFGGGTPSYLSERQLAALTDDLKALLPWDEAEEVAFECEPGTLTEAKLRTIRDIGVTRLSLGVENFNDHILEINGRAHRSPEIDKTYDYARSIGFPQINIDLIAGMLEETEDNWQVCIEKTLAMQPDSVTIYQMEVPFNTTIYKTMKAEGKLASPVAGWDTKRRWVREAFEALESAGYTIGSAYTAIKNPEKQKFLYRDHLWRGADLLSLGVASFGHIQGSHYQNAKDFNDYIGAIDKGELPIQRAYVLSDDERLIREMILQMKLGRLDAGYFQNKFGVPIRDRFAQPFAEMEKAGFLSLADGEIRLSRDGLLQVDRFLESFFLPEHQNARYT